VAACTLMHSLLVQERRGKMKVGKRPSSSPSFSMALLGDSSWSRPGHAVEHGLRQTGTWAVTLGPDRRSSSRRDRADDNPRSNNAVTPEADRPRSGFARVGLTRQQPAAGRADMVIDWGTLPVTPPKLSPATSHRCGPFRPQTTPRDSAWLLFTGTGMWPGAAGFQMGDGACGLPGCRWRWPWSSAGDWHLQ